MSSGSGCWKQIELMQQIMHREDDLLLDEQHSHRTVSREEAQDILIDENNSDMSDLIKTWWHKALDYNV